MDVLLVSLAQLAALRLTDYTVQVIDAIVVGLSWPAFAGRLRGLHPRYYRTQVTGLTLTGDRYRVFVAKSHDAVATAFGAHVTPLTGETLRQFPALDFVLRGEPEMTLRDLWTRSRTPTADGR